MHENALLLEETDLDILAISETHLHKDISENEVYVKYYNIIRKLSPWMLSNIHLLQTLMI